MDTLHVYDTWVNGKNGKLHFDVMTMNEDLALTLAKRRRSNPHSARVPPGTVAGQLDRGRTGCAHARQAVPGGNRGTERGCHPQGVSILP